MSSDNQDSCISFVFNNFGFLALEVVDLLQRGQMFLLNNVVSLMSMNVVFKNIGFAIQMTSDATF